MGEPGFNPSSEGLSDRERRGCMKGMTKTLIGGIAAIALLAAATPAAAYEIRYQDWSRVPDNSAGAVFHPNGDLFEVWDNVKDGVPVWVEWNYKGIRDRWKSLQTTKRHQIFDLHLRRPNHVYFHVVSGYGGPQYISEYRTR
jgi:hypothetical protein